MGTHCSTSPRPNGTSVAMEGGIPWEPQHRHGNKKLWPIWGNVCCPNLRPRSGAGLRPGRENWLLLRRPQMAWIGNRSVYLYSQYQAATGHCGPTGTARVWGDAPWLASPGDDMGDECDDP